MQILSNLIIQLDNILLKYVTYMTIIINSTECQHTIHFLTFREVIGGYGTRLEYSSVDELLAPYPEEL